MLKGFHVQLRSCCSIPLHTSCPFELPSVASVAFFVIAHRAIDGVRSADVSFGVVRSSRNGRLLQRCIALIMGARTGKRGTAQRHLLAGTRSDCSRSCSMSVRMRGMASSRATLPTCAEWPAAIAARNCTVYHRAVVRPYGLPYECRGLE